MEHSGKVRLNAYVSPEAAEEFRHGIITSNNGFRRGGRAFNSEQPDFEFPDEPSLVDRARAGLADGLEDVCRVAPGEIFYRIGLPLIGWLVFDKVIPWADEKINEFKMRRLEKKAEASKTTVEAHQETAADLDSPERQATLGEPKIIDFDAYRKAQ